MTQTEIDALNAQIAGARKDVEHKRSLVEALRGYLKEAEDKLAGADSTLQDLLDKQFDARLGAKK